MCKHFVDAFKTEWSDGRRKCIKITFILFHTTCSSKGPKYALLNRLEQLSRTSNVAMGRRIQTVFELTRLPWSYTPRDG